MRNTISKLYNAVSAPVAATQDALAQRLQNVHETASLLYDRMIENTEYGRQRLKNIVEKEAREEEQQQGPAAAKEAREQEQQQGPAAAKEAREEEKGEEQQQDDEEYDTVPEINLLHEARRVKEFRVTGNLNCPNARMIMDNITSHIEMRVKVIYSFKAEIHRSAGEIVNYSKTLTLPPGMFTSLEEIQAYIEECEQKRLDLGNEEVW